MSDVFQNIGNFLNSGEGKGLMTGGTIGAGFLQNLLANRQASKKQKFIEDLISNPAKFNAYVSNFEKPLQSGLTADISRMTDAYGAERGLGSSPAVMKDVYAQALAPYLLQQQNQAEQTALSSLGIYENSPTTKPVDISSIMKMLLMGSKPTGGSAGDLFADAGLNVMQPSYMPGITTPSAEPAPFDPVTMLPSPVVDGGDSSLANIP